MAPLQVPNGSFSQFGPIWRPMAPPYGFPLHVPSTQNVNLGIHYIQTLIAIPHLHLKRGCQWVMGSRERGRQEATSPFEEKTENPSRLCHCPQTWRFWKMISWYHNWAMIKSVTTSMGSHHELFLYFHLHSSSEEGTTDELEGKRCLTAL